MFPGFQDMQAHGVARRVVKNQRKKIELENGMEAFGKLVKEGFDVTLLSDGLADLEKCLKLPCGRLERRGSAGSIFQFRHKNENSIGLGRVTTEGMRERGRRSFVYSGREFGSRDVVTMDEFTLKRKMALNSARRRAIFLLALRTECTLWLWTIAGSGDTRQGRDTAHGAGANESCTGALRPGAGRRARRAHAGATCGADR